MKERNVDGFLIHKTTVEAYSHTDNAMLITSHYCIGTNKKGYCNLRPVWIQNLIILSTYSNEDVNFIDVIKQNLEEIWYIK